MAEVFLIGILVSPIILCLVLKSNANYIFLSASLGYLLSNFLSKNPMLRSVMVNNINHSGEASANLKLTLILIPVILTTVAMFGTVAKKGMILNLASSVALGFLLTILIVPLLPASLNLLSNTLWNQVKNVQDIVVGAGSIFVLINLLINRPKHSHMKSSKNHG